MKKEEEKIFEVKTTFSNEKEAYDLARILVKEKLVACVQVIPEIKSFYQWQGELQEEKEVLVVAKTTGVLLNNVFSKIRSIHSYETPEIIALQIKEIDLFIFGH